MNDEIDSRHENWYKKRTASAEKSLIARRVLDEVRMGRNVLKAIHANPLPDGGHIAKHFLVSAYYELVESGVWQSAPEILARIRMKPMRSLSGVTTVTVLTKPHPCPGNCIFCPDDARMPKSYLPDEPAAARAYQNDFDPYEQIQSRLNSLTAVGHPTDKIELLILGGCWTAYPREYQEWFVQRCFDALNEEVSFSLEQAQTVNETSIHRNVGLVVETRPDEITCETLLWLRRLGVTKLQMGAQSFDDDILRLNHRGHTVSDTLNACAMARSAGFKIVLHWMPNLLGATLESDANDFQRLWLSSDGGFGFCPDELKIYPTQLLENTTLYSIWQRGDYQPYTTEELVQLIAGIKPGIPPYCRVNRVIRDIPSKHVVEGNKRTSLRQDILSEVKRRGQSCHCIRCREIRGRSVSFENLHLEDYIYHPAYAEEHFLSYVTPDNRLAGYLRLSLPQQDADAFFSDLQGAAIIRELHIYGQSLAVGEEKAGVAQHSGLGTALMQKAGDIARMNGFKRMAVIAAIGTRQYYARRGFERGDCYMLQLL